MNKINKRLVAEYVLCFSLGGALVISALKAGFHINKNTHLPDFYYINNKDINMTSKELLEKIQEIYDDRDELKKYWKDIYLELCDFILKYGEYLDQEQILDTLPDLKFEISEDLDDSLGAYELYQNKIVFNKSLFSKCEEIQKEIIFHESLHYFFFQHFAYSSMYSNEGKSLDEGIVSLLTREYKCYGGCDDYIKNVYYVRIICELIGEDNYICALGHHNINELKNYLCEYASDKDINNLINYIDDSCSMKNDLSYYITRTEYDYKAFEIINKMYEKKHGISIENSDDIIMKCYSNILFDTRYYIDGGVYPYDTLVYKNYFVNRNNTSIVLLDDGMYYGRINIDDKNKTLVK